MKTFDTVIFDMDGTLLNTLEDLGDAMNHILKKNGYPERTLEEVRCAVGNGAGRFLAAMLPDGKDDPDFDRLLKEYGAYYRENCRKKTRPYDGVTELLEQLSAKGIRTAIVSNKGDEAVRELNRLYFGGQITTAVGERQGIQRKPAPDSVLEALNILGSTKERALYVGDSEVDYQTAANAGMACVLVSWGFRHREQLVELNPDWIIDEPKELLQLPLA